MVNDRVSNMSESIQASLVDATRTITALGRHWIFGHKIVEDELEVLFCRALRLHLIGKALMDGNSKDSILTILFPPIPPYKPKPTSPQRED